MSVYPTTREEDLAEQRNARRLRLAGGAAAVLVGGGMAVGFALDWPVRVRSIGWVLPLGLVVVGLVSLRGGFLTTVRADPARLPHADLPLDDPRKQRPLRTRRLVWLLAAALVPLGPAAGFAAAHRLQSSAPGSVRLLLFLGLSYGAMGFGLWAVRHLTGSRLWPHQ